MVEPAHRPSPARTYYEACRGRWRATMGIMLTDAEALRRSGMSWLDRASVRLLAAWPRWLGAVHLDTTVAFDAAGDVEHATVVRWLGLPLRRSVETFALDPDGTRFTVRGGMSGSGSIDASATRGDYALRWLGIDVVQTTTREPDRVTVSQRGPGFHGLHVLVRRSPLPRP